jgi:hypothetical protein
VFVFVGGGGLEYVLPTSTLQVNVCVCACVCVCVRVCVCVCVLPMVQEVGSASMLTALPSTSSL